MSGEKYIGLDVHQATISVAVMDSKGKLIMESILETKASTILEFLAGLRGTLSLTFEEGTWAAWPYDLLKPHVTGLQSYRRRALAHVPGIAASGGQHHQSATRSRAPPGSRSRRLGLAESRVNALFSTFSSQGSSLGGW